MGDDQHHPAEELRILDAELAAAINGLHRARVELGLILRQAVPTDLPSAFASATAEADLSDAVHAQLPEIQNANDDASRGPRFAQQRVDINAINDVYNPAQLDVLRRVRTLLRGTT